MGLALVLQVLLADAQVLEQSETRRRRHDVDVPSPGLDDGDDFVPVAAVPPRLARLLDLFKRAKGQYASCWSGEG